MFCLIEMCFQVLQCFCGVHYYLWCLGCCEDEDAVRNRPQNLDEEERRRQAENRNHHGLSKEELSMTPDQLYYFHQRQQQLQQQQQQEPNPFLSRS